MQSSTGFTKSMSGVVEITDGAGTIIEDGEVETNKIITNNIQGKAASNAITLYTSTTGNVDLRTFRFGNNTISTTQLATLPVNLFTNQTGVGNIIIGNSLSRVFASSFRFRDNLMTVEQPTSLVNLFTTQSGTGSITIGNSAVRVRTSGCIFQNNTLNLLTPSNTASLFTTQTEPIVFGNSTIPITIGSFKFTESSSAIPNSILFNGLSNTPVSLFTTQTDIGTVKIGNPEVLLEFGGFNSLYFSGIQLTQMRAIDYNSLVTLFGNQADNIVLGNPNITCNIGSFNLMNKRITSTTINDPITLFDNQIGDLSIGNATSITKVGQFKFQLVTNTATMTTNVVSNVVNLFTNQTANLIIGNQAINVVVGSFNFLSNSIQLVNTTLAASFFTTNSGPIVIGNSLIQISTGGFNFLGNLLTTNSPTTALNLFTTQTAAINIGNASSSVNINTVTLNVKHGGNSLEMATGNNIALIDFHSNSSFSTDWDARIISIGGSAINGGGSLYLNAQSSSGSINIDTPTFKINLNLFRYVPPTTYVPTLSTGSCPNRRGSYSITGSMMTVHVTFNTVGGAGTVGSGIYGFGIPAGFTIRTVPYTGSGTNGEVQLYDPATGTTGNMSGTSVGNGYLQVRGLSMATTCVVPFTNTSLAVYGTSQSAGITNWHGSTYYQYSYANLVMSFSATFPINF